MKQKKLNELREAVAKQHQEILEGLFSLIESLDQRLSDVEQLHIQQNVTQNPEDLPVGEWVAPPKQDKMKLEDAFAEMYYTFDVRLEKLENRE